MKKRFSAPHPGIGLDINSRLFQTGGGRGLANSRTLNPTAPRETRSCGTLFFKRAFEVSVRVFS